MAKRGRPAARADAGAVEDPSGSPRDAAPYAPATDVLGDFAEDLGRFLGGVQSRATSWLEQRKSIADQLTQIRDTANKYLEQLTGPGVTTPSMLAKEVASREGRARRGRPTGSKNAKPAAAQDSPAPEEAAAQAPAKKRFMSAAARARIAEAQRKRWAKVRRGSRNANR